MRIVRQGKPPSERLYEGTCLSRKTVVEFKRGEAQYVSDQRDGDYLTVACPICENDISVSVKNYREEG